MIFKDVRQLRDRIKNKEREMNLPANTLLNYYMMERFLERLICSQYKDNFVIKGGFLISSLIGVDMRSTMDIDATMKGIVIYEESVEKIIKEIIEIPLEDNVTFSFEKIRNIHEKGKYEDFRITLMAHFFNMRVPIKIDLTTGDLIIPREIDHQYKPIFSDQYITIKAYPITTILAEKLESIFVRSTLNTRARDYYDIYMLLKLNPHLDHNKVLEATEEKSRERNTLEFFENRNRYIDEIEKSEELNSLWKAYQRKHKYADSIEWEEILNILKEFREHS